MKLKLLNQLQWKIGTAEERIRQVVRITAEVRLFMSIPGAGPILAILIALEIGYVAYFGDDAQPTS
jgi:transposase